MSEDDELEELRRRRALELQKNLAQDQQQSDAEKRLEAQKQVLMRRILTQEARQRLTNLKMVKPEFASQLELQLIQIAQQGKIELPIGDEQLKEILQKLQSGHKEITIRRV
jgi:programmed cell death protein 5